MVYESDFYTTRRPYTRPISTSYTVTVKRIPHLLPYIAHKRLITVVHTPVHSYYYPAAALPIRINSRVRPSVLAAELQRIRDLRRSTYQSYTASYLSSRPSVLWDDETREIRARADALLRRIHVFVPRPLASDFAEDIIPERMHSDDYIRRLIGARKNAKKDEEAISYYDSPEQRHFGTGNLACVAYTGGKPHSRRRPYYKLADLRPADVQSDVNMLSYYAKNRQAAASAYPDPPLTDREIRKARALENEEEPRPKRVPKQEPEPTYERELETVYEPEAEVVTLKLAEAAHPEPEPEPIIEPEAEQIFEPASQTTVVPEPEAIQESKVVPEPESEVIAEPERISQPESEIIGKTQPAVITETESEVVAEHEHDPIAEAEAEMIVEPEAEPEVFAEAESEAIVQSEPEVIEEPEMEQTVAQPETEMEATGEESADEAVDQRSIVAEGMENADVKTDNETEDEENEEVDEDVLQRKLDEEELRRQVEELKRQAEAEERRRAEEARLAEERWKQEEEERIRREKEEKERRLAEIEEQERLEAERKIEEERWEAERIRDAKLAEIEKRAAEFDAILAMEEEERYAIEKATEEARKRQEREERLASEVILGASEDLHHPDGSYNECHCHPEVNCQELEGRPESPDAEDDTQIEEEECGGETDHDETTDPFVVEHEGFNSAPAEIVDAIDDAATVEESDTNVDNFWGDSDA